MSLHHEPPHFAHVAFVDQSNFISRFPLPPVRASMEELVGTRSRATRSPDWQPPAKRLPALVSHPTVIDPPADTALSCGVIRRTLRESVSFHNFGGVRPHKTPASTKCYVVPGLPQRSYQLSSCQPHEPLKPLEKEQTGVHPTKHESKSHRGGVDASFVSSGKGSARCVPQAAKTLPQQPPTSSTTASTMADLKMDSKVLRKVLWEPLVYNGAQRRDPVRSNSLCSGDSSTDPGSAKAKVTFPTNSGSAATTLSPRSGTTSASPRNAPTVAVSEHQHYRKNLKDSQDYSDNESVGPHIPRVERRGKTNVLDRPRPVCRARGTSFSAPDVEFDRLANSKALNQTKSFDRGRRRWIQPPVPQLDLEALDRHRAQASSAKSCQSFGRLPSGLKADPATPSAPHPQYFLPHPPPHTLPPRSKKKERALAIRSSVFAPLEVIDATLSPAHLMLRWPEKELEHGRQREVRTNPKLVSHQANGRERLQWGNCVEKSSERLIDAVLKFNKSSRKLLNFKRSPGHSFLRVGRQENTALSQIFHRNRI